MEALMIDTLEKILNAWNNDNIKTQQEYKKLKFNIAIKNQKRKKIEDLHNKKYEHLEALLRTCEDRKVELEAELVSLKEVIEDVTATNTKLQSKVVKFEKEKEENDSVTMRLNQQVKDWKEKYKAKENENRRLKLEYDNAINQSKELY